MPVIKHYSAQGKIAEVRGTLFFLVATCSHDHQIGSSGSVEEVYKSTCEVIKEVLSGKYIK
jgi:hypothetical protein